MLVENRTFVTSSARFSGIVVAAIERKSTAAALALLSHGADPSLECGPSLPTGLTLLHHCLAPEGSHLSKEELILIKQLIEKGADTESTSIFDAAMPALASTCP